MSNPYEAPRFPGHIERPDPAGRSATISMVLGLVSILTWCLPILGLPTTITGLVFGIKGLNSERRGQAIAGIVLSTSFLVFTVANVVYGVYLAATGQHPFVQ